MEELDKRTFFVQPTTGGQIEISLPTQSSVKNLKLYLAKRLKIPKDKIILLHRNKQLVEGSLLDNNIAEGSKLTLLPNVETGLVTQNPEQCVIQALETLNETQVENFLNGRSPLNLTMRIGDHMMFIQLQLSTVISSSPSNNSSTSSPPPTPPTTPTSTTSAPPFPSTVITSTATTSITSPLSPPPSPQLTTPPIQTPFEPPGGGSSNNDDSPFSNQVLTEASRNLTHTLKQLSSSALTKKMNESCNGRCCIARRHGGAVIESMYHHGKGVFSGTFSGTLSPLLQDKEGRPRRNICTIVHILNDLLGASSHCNPSPKCNAHQTHNAHKDVSNEDVLRQKEDKVLREKVQHIQTLLKEKRKYRSNRTGSRPSPYPTVENRRSNGLFFSTTLDDRHEEQQQTPLADYSSETAAA